MPSPNPTTRRILLIAGSDSSGGAGIEADQRVLALHHCYALSAITALTCQTTTAVYDIHPTPTHFVVKTINAVWNDVGVDVVKIGMLATSQTARAVAAVLRHQRHADNADNAGTGGSSSSRAGTCSPGAYGTVPVVLDPVMKATSGALLVPPDAIAVIREELLPLAMVVTPNVPEAMLLVSSSSSSSNPSAADTTSSANSLSNNANPPESIDELTALAKRVWQLSGQGWVLLKGGHCVSERVTDVLVHGQQVVLFEREVVRTKNLHGTGCSLASAVAAGLARGLDVPEAVRRACEYVAEGIRGAVEWEVGRGAGPIDHWAGKGGEG